MKAQILATVASAALLAGCSAAYGEDLDTIGQPDMAAADLPEATGYFAADSTLPFQTPDFSSVSKVHSRTGVLSSSHFSGRRTCGKELKNESY